MIGTVTTVAEPVTSKRRDSSTPLRSRVRSPEAFAQGDLIRICAVSPGA